MDINEQKTAANELTWLNTQLEDQAKFPQENPNPVIRVKKDGTILFANNACTVLDSFKCEEGQVLPKQYKKIVARVMETGKPEQLEVQGKDRIFTLNFVPIAKTGYANLYATDITERKKAENLLHESEERFRALSETSPLGVGVSSEEGELLYANPSYEAILGYGPGELLGKKATDLYMDPEDRRAWLARMKKSGVVRDLETRLKRKDGKPVWVSISVSPISYGGKNAVMGTIQDITERKQSDGVKDEFIGLVSHELRTPLTVIIGALGTAKDERVTKEQREELVKDASTSAESLASILDNMLELSRSQAGRLKLEVKPIKIAEVAENAIKRVRRKYDDHKIVIDFPASIPEVKLDASRIEQVIYNLVENAIKYSPAGTQVRVFGRREDESMVVGVSDEGVGITPAEQAKLFQPFSRLEAKGHQGIGLGLVVCKHLVEAHKGCVWVESQPGKGTNFLFSIPLPKGGD